MHEDLKTCLAELLAKPRALKPQAERQLVRHLEEHGDLATFAPKAAQLLEDHELEILFAPMFTPELEDQAAVSDALSKGKPSDAELAQLALELTKGTATIQQRDGITCTLPLHAVMVERFMKLLRLNQAPPEELVIMLQDALPSDLYRIAAALLRQKGFDLARQVWYVAFMRHMARCQVLKPGMLIAAADFIIDQPKLDHPALLDAARKLVIAAKGAAEYAQAGRIYWSPDVAQHHSFRGEGRIDESLVKQRLDELNALEVVVAALETYK